MPESYISGSAPHKKATNADVTLARLQEMMKYLARQSEHTNARLESITNLQVIIDRNNRELPQIKQDVNEAKEGMHEMRRTLAHLRWFFMGVGAAFGFLGGAVSESVRGVLKVVLG